MSGVTSRAASQAGELSRRVSDSLMKISAPKLQLDQAAEAARSTLARVSERALGSLGGDGGACGENTRIVGSTSLAVKSNVTRGTWCSMEFGGLEGFPVNIRLAGRLGLSLFVRKSALPRLMTNARTILAHDDFCLLGSVRHCVPLVSKIV